jgi:hypothetical protein
MGLEQVAQAASPLLPLGLASRVAIPTSRQAAYNHVPGVNRPFNQRPVHAAHNSSPCTVAFLIPVSVASRRPSLCFEHPDNVTGISPERTKSEPPVMAMSRGYCRRQAPLVRSFASLRPLRRNRRLPSPWHPRRHPNCDQLRLPRPSERQSR